MSVINSDDLSSDIKRGIEFYNYVKSKNNGIADLGDDENSISGEAIKHLYNNQGKPFYIKNISNVYIRPIEGGIVMNVNSNLVQIKKFASQINEDREYYVSGMDGSLYNSNIIISNPVDKKFPISFKQIKKIKSINPEIIKHVQFGGGGIETFENLNFESNLPIKYSRVNTGELKTFEHLNNCKAPKLIICGCTHLIGLEKISKENIPTVELDDINGTLRTPIRLYGLLPEMFREDSPSPKITINFGRDENKQRYSAYKEFALSHPDLYSNPLKHYILKELFDDYYMINDHFIKKFNSTLESFGYRVDSNDSISKVTNKLIGLLLK